MTESMSRLERGQVRRKRRKRLAWVLTILIVVLLAGGGAWAYWGLQPEHHFLKVPLLQGDASSPSSASSTAPQTKPTTAPSTPDPASTGPSTTDSNGAINVLILGIDAQNGEQDARTDVIMAAHVNLHTKTINLVSIPRDTRVNLPGVGMTKINHAHFLGNLQSGNHGGTEQALQAVQEFLGVKFNYYVKTNFQGFEHVVDSVGGVDVNFPQAIGTYFTAGPHHLNGEEALLAVRERYSMPRGDLDREADQAIVLDALLQQVLQPSNMPKLPGLYQQVHQDLIDTNFTDSDLLSLAMLLKGMKSSQIQYVQIPGQNGVAYDPLVKMDLDYWMPDLQAVKHISETYLH